MLGIIFFLLQRFLRKELGPAAWKQLFAEAGIGPKMYLAENTYPAEEAIGLLQAAGRLKGRSVPDLVESFGYVIAPDLLGLFRSLIRPEWKTLDLLENVETMHTAMRKRNPVADPPVVQGLRISETEMQLTYTSKRRLCTLAKGIIRGVAGLYGEDVEIVEHSCMHSGYLYCTFHVRIVPRPLRPIAALEVTVTRTPSGGVALTEGSNPWAALSSSHARLADVGIPETKELPSRIVQYRILGQLGAGGMGVVYLAEDEMLGRQVAIKLMLPAVAALPENRDRFLREARSMAALSNDHVVPVYQVGHHEDRPFIVMPWLRGKTLEQHLVGPDVLTHAEVARIGREIALGLAAAHEAGLVHRDIKPSNIWLEEPGRRVKILDFGIARSDDRVGRLTQTGMMLGTPLYMSPEQAAGEPVDGRSDLFSLGAILYRMCSGRTPFQGDLIMALLRSIAVETPRPLAEVNPNIPSALAEIVMHLLAKDPADRPASAIATAEAFLALPPDSDITDAGSPRTLDWR